MNAYTRGARLAILAAALIIAANWEIGYGHALGLGRFAFALPVLTDGYLLLALEVRRDVPAAVATFTCSLLLGALEPVVHWPAPALAAATATLVAVVLYRAHVITDRPADRSTGRRPVAEPVADRSARPLRPVALPADVPAPATVTATLPEPVDGEEPTDRAVVERLVRENDIDMTDRAAVRALRAAMREQLPHLTPDAVRGLHRRVLAELEGAAA